MKCQNCGAEIMNGAQFCPVCGNSAVMQVQGSGFQQPMNQGYQQYGGSQNFQQPYGMQNVSNEDASLVIKIISFLIPIVGIILYFVKKNESPVYAKSCLTWGLIGFVVSFLWAVF